MAKRDKAAYLGVRLLRTRLLEGRADEAPHSLLVNASEGVKVQQPLYNKNTKNKTNERHNLNSAGRAHT